MMDYVDDTHAWWPRSVVIIRFLIADVQLRGWSVIERHQCSLSLSRSSIVLYMAWPAMESQGTYHIQDKQTVV